MGACKTPGMTGSAIHSFELFSSIWRGGGGGRSLSERESKL